MARASDRSGVKISVDSKAVEKALATATGKILKRFKKTGMAGAARPMAEAAKSNLQQNKSVDFGALRDSVDVKQGEYRKRDGMYILVGPARGAKFTIVDAATGKRVRVPTKYAHLVEFGTAPHRQAQGEHPGAAPKPFLRPAFDATRGTVEKRIEDGLRDALKEVGK